MNRLLIISCSATKRGRRRAACNLYGGPVFQDLAKRERTIGELGADVLVLSARHGLVGFRAWLNRYDQRMDHHTAHSQAPTNENTLRQLQRERRYAEVMIVVGKQYRAALGNIGCWSGKARVVLAGGRGIGDMRKQMSAWLGGAQ